MQFTNLYFFITDFIESIPSRHTWVARCYEKRTLKPVRPEPFYLGVARKLALTIIPEHDDLFARTRQLSARNSSQVWFGRERDVGSKTMTQFKKPFFVLTPFFISLSQSFSFSLSLSVVLNLSANLSHSLSLSFSLSIFLILSLSLFLSVVLNLSLSVAHNLFAYLSQSLSPPWFSNIFDVILIFLTF